ncbi:MAG: hypothetical protein M3P39_09255 [Actinomycetota bacterium]|jgi:hypothetical protein|nr:hypothetical protein [Actinomycetota bacterium]
MAQQRVNIGFYGTQVLPVRVEEGALRGLLDGLAEGGWHELTTDDGTVRLNLAQVVYVKVDRADQRVGFGL